MTRAPDRGPRRRRYARPITLAAAMLIAFPFLGLSLTVGTAAATGGLTVTNYSNAQVQGARSIVAGPDGALWFTNIGSDSIGGSPPPESSPTTPTPP